MQENPFKTSVQYVKWVGPHRATLFQRLGVQTVGDLLYFLPRQYHQRGQIRPIAEVQPGETATVAGIVLETQLRTISQGRTLFSALIEDEAGSLLRTVWFNQPYRAEDLRPGKRVVLHGKVSLYDDLPQMNSPEYEIVGPSGPRRLIEGIVPIYPTTEGLYQWQIRRAVRAALEKFGDQISEPLPEALRLRNRLPPLKQAIAHVHFPPTMEAAEAARRRLKFDELFVLQMGLAFRRWRRRSATATPILVDERLDQRIRRRFPFVLTPAQERVIGEIRADLTRDRPMNRLLQGDVGSGKTVVAVYALLAAVANRLQTAVMAPTAILAEQHFTSIDRMLRGSRVRRALLVGGMPQTKRHRVLTAVARGEIDILIGTHALIQRDVKFRQLGLVVVDEQHKFGVAQRAMLRRKGRAPHCLVMTATPIPRTLAMAVFGDLDISVIDQMPPGRRPVETRYVPRQQMEGVFEFIRSEVRRGRQAYFVYPLVSESDRLALRSATQMHHLLSQSVFPDLRVGLLHGQMKPSEKEKVMADFRTRRIHILVSTVVIEVGIDVPNATLMVIDHAERFGLAQLHQLRGRIGRGRYQAYCFLLAEPKTEEARRRLEILTRTTDGFRIAEEDMRLRGPGEFLGTRQHGLPELRIANLVEDGDLLRLARKEAFNLVETDPKLTQHAPLRELLRERLRGLPGLTPIG